MIANRKAPTSASTRFGVALLVLGGVSLVVSILYTYSILAFIGLGLVFWGMLFSLLKPVRQTSVTVLEGTALSSYLTIDRIIKSLKYIGKAYYIPPYPKDVYLPDHLKGLKDVVIFFSAESNTEMPSIVEMAEGRFFTEKSKGAMVIPPGAGLLEIVEKKSNVDFSGMNLENLCDTLAYSIANEYNLAQEVEMSKKGNQVLLRVRDSVYKGLYGRENNIKSISVIGCPLASAVACALAKASAQAIAIEKLKVSSDGMMIEVVYSLVRG